MGAAYFQALLQRAHTPSAVRRRGRARRPRAIGAQAARTWRVLWTLLMHCACIPGPEHFREQYGIFARGPDIHPLGGAMLCGSMYLWEHVMASPSEGAAEVSATLTRDGNCIVLGLARLLGNADKVVGEGNLSNPPARAGARRTPARDAHRGGFLHTVAWTSARTPTNNGF